MSEELPRCEGCGARLNENAEWCPVCLKKVEPEPTFAPPDAFLGPPTSHTYSRTAKTTVSYGPWGRAVATILLVVLPLGFLLTFAFPFGVIYLVAAVPLLFKSIWKKTPLPPGGGQTRP